MSSAGSQGEDLDQEDEQKVEIFRYFTHESVIQPNNEHTQKIRREKRERELFLKQAQDEEDKIQKMLDEGKKDHDKREKDQERAMLERRKLQEIKKEEELIELKELKGNFARTVLEMRSNLNPLEMTMTGTDFSSVQRRLIYKALENNSSLKVRLFLLF